MKAKITTNFAIKHLEKAITKAYTNYQRRVILRFQFIGEKFITNARISGDYNDITGNLRSSIGYIVLHLGQAVHEQYVEGKGKKGKEEAKKVLDELIQQFPTGIVLIVVAGMNYAAAAESRGRDVITSSAINMKNDLRKLFAKNKRNF